LHPLKCPEKSILQTWSLLDIHKDHFKIHIKTILTLYVPGLKLSCDCFQSMCIGKAILGRRRVYF
jgi:hypothetical protein